MKAGYLNTINIFGAQSYVAGNTQSTSSITKASVIPEVIGTKTIRGGALITSYLSSDSDTSVAAGNFLVDSDISIGSPSCSNSYYGKSDGQNSYNLFYRKVAGSINTTNNTSYNICISNNGAGDTSGGAKMNSILTYTYEWKNSPPTGAINSAAQKTDGSGVVDLSIEIDDADDDETRAKIEFATGTTCVFSTPGDPTLDTNSANISADFGTVQIDNASAYQVGTSTDWIKTASGSNTINFDWTTNRIGQQSGTYCIRLSVNDD
jgi:hypothetical protein